MLHRTTLRLYDENPLDAEILDFLSDFDGPRKQDLLRTMLRVGFNEMHNNKDSKKIKKVVDEDVNSMMNKKDVKKRVSKKTADKKDNKVITQELKEDEITTPELRVPVDSDLILDKGIKNKQKPKAVSNEVSEDIDDLDPLAMLAGKISS